VATAPNLGTGGTALDAQFGSSSTSNTNEPLALAHSGTNYLYLPGVSGNYASAPDSAALSITGDIDLRALVAFDDWTPTSTHPIMAKRSGGTAATWSYELLNVSGSLRIQWFDTGTGGFRNLTSSVVNSITDGTSKWVRATLDVDNGAAGCTATFYTSDDAATWTTLGTAQTAATIAAISDSTAALEIGSNQSGAGGQAGNFYRAQVLSGIGGTVVFDANFTTGITSGAQATFTESSSNAATVTINRASSGRKSVAVVRSVWLLGTDDFFEIADNDLIDFTNAQDFTLVSVIRAWGTTADDTLIAKKTSTAAGTTGYALEMSTSSATTGRLSDGTTQHSPTATTRTAGALTVLSLVRSGSTVTAYHNSTAGTPVTITATGAFANAEVMRLGRLSGAGTNYADCELVAAMVFRRALSATELAQIATYYGVA
jgi:hypothetical protein